MFHSRRSISRSASKCRITEAPGAANATALYSSAAGQVIAEDIDAGSVYLHAQYVWSPVYINAMVVQDYDFQGGGSGFNIAERTYVTQDANWNVTGLISQFTLPGDANGDGAVNGIDLGILAGNMFHNVSGGDAAGDFSDDGVVNGVDLGMLAGNLYLTHSASWQVAEHFVYDAYGQFTVTNASWSTASVEYLGWNYTFQGMRYDAAIGDNFSLTRVYNPRIGTWLSQDPMGYVDGASLYQAMGGSPINHVDPKGLYTVHVDITVALADRPTTFNQKEVTEKFYSIMGADAQGKRKLTRDVVDFLVTSSPRPTIRVGSKDVSPQLGWGKWTCDNRYYYGELNWDSAPVLISAGNSSNGDGKTAIVHLQNVNLSARSYTGKIVWTDYWANTLAHENFYHGAYNSLCWFDTVDKGAGGTIESGVAWWSGSVTLSTWVWDDFVSKLGIK